MADRTLTFQMATEGKVVAAAIFWLKARGRWRERHENDGDDKALTVTIKGGLPD